MAEARNRSVADAAIEKEFREAAERLALPVPIQRLFIQAHARRVNGSTHAQKPIDAAEVGLGSDAEYKLGVERGLFAPIEAVKVRGRPRWYRLTASGVETYQALFGEAAHLEPFKGTPYKFDLALNQSHRPAALRSGGRPRSR